MYYRICPLCQELCEYNKFAMCYFCDHENEDFQYEAVGNKKSNFREISFVTKNYTVKLNLISENTSILDSNDKKFYHLSFLIPIDWNNFELEDFENKINKIIQFQIFD